MDTQFNENIINKLNILELKHFGQKNSDTIHNRCNKLEKYLGIYQYPNLNTSEIMSQCHHEEDYYTYLNMRIHFIANNIDITKDINLKLQKYI
tara:strand:- start:124 stop:402 length:279 start_codon:yes stop_codon:yes gene_type:complete